MFPQKIGPISQTKVTYIYLGIVTVLLICFNFHYLFTKEIYFQPLFDTQDSPVESVCVITLDSWEFHVDTWPWLDVMVSSLIPFVLILSANVAITYKVIQLTSLVLNK